VENGTTGLLVPVGDPDATSAALERCLREATTWGPRARTHVTELFDLDRVVDRWLDLLHDVLSPAHAP
ncbi:MAG: glycosyltransferase, partial [Actinomycetes bacterium]